MTFHLSLTYHISKTLRANGVMSGREKVPTLMRRMGIEAINQRTNTSKTGAGYRIYLYPLRGLKNERPNRSDHYNRWRTSWCTWWRWSIGSQREAIDQIRDRLSFTRFLGLGLEDRVPDAKTLWLYREALVQAGLIEQLFAMFDVHLCEQGYQAMGGQIVDASIVAAPKQRNTREENAAINAGAAPAAWQDKPAMPRQKDIGARWTKKNGRSLFGYKNHIGIDRRHKFVRRYAVTHAARHDSQEIDTLLDPTNSCADVWADSAYRSAEIEAKLVKRGQRSRIHRRAARGHHLSAREQAANTTRSRVRVRVGHVFGHLTTAMGGKVVRTIGLARATAKIGMMNLAYNMSRLATLQRLAARPS
jgi:IS5 family transposase